MVIYFFQRVVHEDGSRPTLSRLSFGEGHRSSLVDFLLDVFPQISSLIFRSIRHGNIGTLVDDGSGLHLKASRRICFTITLKF